MKQFDWHDSGIVPGHAFSFDLDPFMSLIPRKKPFNREYFSSAVNSAIKKLHHPMLTKEVQFKFPAVFFVKKQEPQL